MLSKRLRGQNHDEAEKKQNKSFTIRLSFAGLVGIAAVCIIVIGWVFSLGMIIGRGYAPEDKLPALGKLIPDMTEKVKENREILKAEDLTFMSELKSQPGLGTDEKESPNLAGTAKLAATTVPTANTPLPVTDKKNQETDKTPSAARNAPAREVQKLKEEQKDIDNRKYNFIYQVIAYKKAEQADNFREKLERAGLRTRLNIERDAKGRVRLYRVQVLVRGTEKDAEKARNIIAKNGVKNPFLSSRKLAGQ